MQDVRTRGHSRHRRPAAARIVARGYAASMVSDPAPHPPIAPTARQEPVLFWEDFPAGCVMDFGGMHVDREAVIAFAGQFDPQPFHLDEQAARESLFGGLCASGWHTAAMTMRMLCDGYLLRSASLGSPGIDALRWVQPVFPGDTLSVRMEVLQARPMQSRPDVGLVQCRWTVGNQHAQTVMTMEGWGMFRRRATGNPPAGAAAP
jgi:acyl dehydratase